MRSDDYFQGKQDTESELLPRIECLTAEVTEQKTVREALRFALHLAYRDAGMSDQERQKKVASVINGAETAERKQLQ